MGLESYILNLLSAFKQPLHFANLARDGKENNAMDAARQQYRMKLLDTEYAATATASHQRRRPKAAGWEVALGAACRR